jgi:hypothetical protein
MGALSMLSAGSIRQGQGTTWGLQLTKISPVQAKREPDIRSGYGLHASHRGAQLSSALGQARSTAKRLRSAREQCSRAPSCVARKTTRGAWPASRASCQRGAHRRARRASGREKPISGIGVERSLPRDFESSRNSAVITEQTVWLPMSSRLVSQQPSRKNPVMGLNEQTSNRSPSTLGARHYTAKFNDLDEFDGKI